MPRKPKFLEGSFAVLHSRCAALDVHKDSIMACLLTPGEGDEPHSEVRQFGTTTRELEALARWMLESGITHAAMESTGVYWKPVCELTLVNARDVKQVPGRKTDVADCVWLAKLLRYGLLKASFVPDLEIRELRDLCRMRTTQVRESVQVGNRIRKVLEDANIKLDSVASDLLGLSGRTMIQAIIEGEQNPAVLAELARARMRSKIPQLTLALEGRVRPHHRFLLKEWMWILDRLEEQILRLEEEIEKRMPPFEWAVTLLMDKPGFDRVAARNLIAEIGADMSRFPSARHLASWAGVCPGNNESAGKKRSGKSHRGNRWVKGTLTQIAWAASRKKNSYEAALYKRLVPHRGKKRALVALANSTLQAVWHMLSKRQTYIDLGADYFETRQKEKLTRTLLKRLEKLGHKVTIEQVAA
jgi:transposase